MVRRSVRMVVSMDVLLMKYGGQERVLCRMECKKVKQSNLKHSKEKERKEKKKSAYRIDGKAYQKQWNDAWWRRWWWRPRQKVTMRTATCRSMPMYTVLLRGAQLLSIQLLFYTHVLCCSWSLFLSLWYVIFDDFTNCTLDQSIVKASTQKDWAHTFRVNVNQIQQVTGRSVIYTEDLLLGSKPPMSQW